MHVVMAGVPPFLHRAAGFMAAIDVTAIPGYPQLVVESTSAADQQQGG